MTLQLAGRDTVVMPLLSAAPRAGSVSVSCWLRGGNGDTLANDGSGGSASSEARNVDVADKGCGDYGGKSKTSPPLVEILWWVVRLGIL